MRLRSFCLLSIALLTSCATGAGDDDDGVIVRGDTRGDDDGTDPEDTSPSIEDTGTTGTTDTGSPDKDSGAPTDTGTEPTDTGPTACSGEEPEPNNTAATARALAGIDDCDSSGGTVTGVLSSESDVDVLTFDGSDVLGCSVNPTVSVTGPARVCIRAACKSGTTEMQGCPKGTKTGTECCGTTTEIEINCTGTTSDDAKITVTVRADSSSLTCAAYSVSYHY